MSKLVFEDILVSSNRKTGHSVNVDQCSPTPWCRARCYRCFRDEAMIKANGWSSTPNSGPITWRTQRAAYRRNEQAIKRAAATGRLDAAAAGIAARLARTGMPLRGNGTGDLFPELCHLYARIAFYGKPVFLFSRRPEMILELLYYCDEFGLKQAQRPFVLASIDPSTSLCQCHQLADATAAINGKPVFAYATDTPGDPGAREARSRTFSQYFHVVFGYHTNFVRTIVNHTRACPATNGEAVHCDKCRRCFGLDTELWRWSS